VRKRLAEEEAAQMAAGTTYVLYEEVSASQLVTMGLGFEEQQYVPLLLDFAVLTTHHSDVNWPSTSAPWVHIQRTNRRQGYSIEPISSDERYPPGSSCSTYTSPACISFVTGTITVHHQIYPKSLCLISNSTYHPPLMQPRKSHAMLGCAG
jgi:hypothetical protein